MTNLVGWKTWDGDRCDHCCNGDRCDEPDHFSRHNCPYCKGTGNAIWINKCAVCSATSVESCNDRGCFFFENGNREPQK